MKAPDTTAAAEWLALRAQMGHETGLMVDACHDFGRAIVTQFLLDECFADIEQALSCHMGDCESLWGALEEFADQYEADNGPFGVGA
jgi:hypothetical protein